MIKNIALLLLLLLALAACNDGGRKDGVEAWPNITPRPTNAAVGNAWATVYAQLTAMPGQPVPGQVTPMLVAPADQGRLPYTFPPGYDIMPGMPIVTETPEGAGR